MTNEEKLILEKVFSDIGYEIIIGGNTCVIEKGNLYIAQIAKDDDTAAKLAFMELRKIDNLGAQWISMNLMKYR